MNSITIQKLFYNLSIYDTILKGFSIENIVLWGIDRYYTAKSFLQQLKKIILLPVKKFWLLAMSKLYTNIHTFA